jgi:hypothetical protein
LHLLAQIRRSSGPKGWYKTRRFRVHPRRRRREITTTTTTAVFPSRRRRRRLNRPQRVVVIVVAVIVPTLIPVRATVLLPFLIKRTPRGRCALVVVRIVRELALGFRARAGEEEFARDVGVTTTTAALGIRSGSERRRRTRRIHRRPRRRPNLSKSLLFFEENAIREIFFFDRRFLTCEMCTTLDHEKREHRQMVSSIRIRIRLRIMTRVVLNKAAFALACDDERESKRETRETQSHRAVEKNFHRALFFPFFFLFLVLLFI